jgi:hypothetical protein
MYGMTEWIIVVTTLCFQPLEGGLEHVRYNGTGLGFVVFVFFAALGFEFRASYLLGRCCTT